jgi:hypothetical protein
MKRLYLAAAIAASLLLVAIAAQAGCFPGFGCTDKDFFRRADLAKQSCETLWKMRGTILKERGYCFEKERDIAAFGNAGCRFAFGSSLLLNSVERDNYSNVAKLEKSKHCPR